MRLRTLMLIGMVLAFLFALALLLGPAIILKFFGLTGSATETMLGQLLGAGLIGVGILCWFAKDGTEPGPVLALFVASAVAFVVTLLSILAKVPKGGTAWIAAILLLLFAAGFAYFQFAGPRE